MTCKHVGAIPVCDGDKLFGMITDRDLVTRVVAEGRNPKIVQVSKAMTPEIVYCFEDDDLEKAAQLMAHRQIRRLPILWSAKKLVGIVTLGDLAVQVRTRNEAVMFWNKSRLQLIPTAELRIGN